jgi:hypothetical protein
METNITLHTKNEEDEYKERVSYEFSLRAPFHICYTMSYVIPPPPHLPDRLTLFSSDNFL